MRRLASLFALLVIAVSAGAVLSPSGAAEVQTWSKVLSVEGRIVDVSADAVLYRQGSEVRHLSMATGVDRLVTSTAVGGGVTRLTPSGALVTEAAGAFPAARLRHWTPTASLDLGIVVSDQQDEPGELDISGWPVATDGNWVAWSRQRNADGSGGGLLLRNVVTGAQRVVTSSLVAELDVAPDGTVAFVRSGHVFRDRAGVVVQVTPAGAGTGVHGPLTDGTAVMYGRFVPSAADPEVGLSSLLVSSGGGETVLAGPHQCRVVPFISDCEWFYGIPIAGLDYAIFPGVQAWNDEGGLWHKVGSSPARLAFEGWTWITDVGPGGQIVFHHVQGISGEIIILDDPYYVAADGTVVPIHRPTEAGIDWAGAQPVSFQGGDLYVLELDDSSGPQLRYEPDDVTALPGTLVDFQAAIGGYPQPLIQWERSVDGVTFVPVGSPFQERDLSFLTVRAGEGGYRFFRAKATGPDGTVTTRAARLTVGTPVVVPGSGSGPEGDTAGSTVRVPVTLPRTPAPVYLDWRTVVVPGLADQATPGADYTPSSGTLAISTYTTSASIEIPVVGDTVIEKNERIVVAFSNPMGATIGGFYGLGFATIVDDDLPRLSIGSGAALEGNVVRVPVTLNKEATGTVRARWATVHVAGHPGQATPGVDYIAGSGTVTFPPGQTIVELLITTREDGVAEPPEGFFVQLSDGVGAKVDGWGVGGGVIYDDD
jgi:hypothetical protein